MKTSDYQTRFKLAEAYLGMRYELHSRSIQEFRYMPPHQYDEIMAEIRKIDAILRSLGYGQGSFRYGVATEWPIRA